MLTVEHIRAFRRGKQISLTPLWGLSPTAATALLDELLVTALEHHGRTRGELVAAFNELVVDENSQRALRGASKLVLDQCDFAERDDIDPPSLRDALYRKAAGIRSAGGAVDADAITAAVAADKGLDVATFNAALYADLDEARLVDATALRSLTAQSLLPVWEQAEQQALLLRATQVVIEVDARPAELRALLRTMKLFQLLFEIEPLKDGGARFIVDGPMSMFSQSLRYGQKLALLLPKVQACKVHRLRAEVQLKKGGSSAPFEIVGKRPVEGEVDNTDLSPLVQQLLTELPEKLTGALSGSRVEVCSDVVAVPGVGACVPDLVVVEKKTKRRLYIEVLGFWSREAVFKRIALVTASTSAVPLLLCVSDRLRVSEAALDSEHGALLTFKGALSAKKVADRLAQLAG